MRYQIKIIRPNRKRWLRREVAQSDLNFASTNDLHGAHLLLAGTPFYIGELCVIEDVHTHQWVGIKRGRVTQERP